MSRPAHPAEPCSADGARTAVAEYVWGVDVSTSRIAVGFAPRDGGAVEVESVCVASDCREGERLGLLDRQLRIWVPQLADRAAAVVWIEQPSGRFRNLTLSYFVGVTAAAFFEALDGVPVWLMPPSAWKRSTVGVGNATKVQARAWAERHGLPELSNSDEADAFCIAAAGRAMVDAGSWGAVG